MTRTIGRLIQTGLLAATLTCSASALAQSGAGVTGQGTMPTQPGSKAGGPWNPDRQVNQSPSSPDQTEPRGTTGTGQGTQGTEESGKYGSTAGSHMETQGSSQKHQNVKKQQGRQKKTHHRSNVQGGSSQGTQGTDSNTGSNR